jgi:hypothetical protein
MIIEHLTEQRTDKITQSIPVSAHNYIHSARFALSACSGVLTRFLVARAVGAPVHSNDDHSETRVQLGRRIEVDLAGFWSGNPTNIVPPKVHSISGWRLLPPNLTSSRNRIPRRAETLTVIPKLSPAWCSRVASVGMRRDSGEKQAFAPPMVFSLLPPPSQPR